MGGVVLKSCLWVLFVSLCLFVGCSMLIISVQNWTTLLVLVRMPSLQDGTKPTEHVPQPTGVFGSDSVQTKQNLVHTEQTGSIVKVAAIQGRQYATKADGSGSQQHLTTKATLFSRERNSEPNISEPIGDGYIVYTPGCKIPKYNPFDNTIEQFVRKGTSLLCDRRFKVLSALLYQDGNWLRINNTELKIYNTKLDYCYYSVITRKPHDDVAIQITGRIRFEADIEILKVEFITVECFVEQKTRSVYRNYFAFVTPNKKAQTKSKSREANRPSRNNDRLSVILLGADSVSRLNSVRQLPKTRGYLLKQLGAFEMFGYNKVGDNTFDNMVPMLTGKYVSELPYDIDTMARKYFDDYDIVWKNFADAGFATQYAEDTTSGAMFNYMKAGFKEPPADYYLRPFSIAMQADKSLFHEGKDCFAGRMHTKILLDYLSEFVKVSNSHNTPFFALTFITFLTHDYLNKLGGADEVYLTFFKSLKDQGHLENTAIFFFGDHGFRYGGIRNTYIGKIEGRLPMMYLYFPEWFRRKYPKITENLYSNSGVLTTAFDIYETLKDILYMNDSFPTPRQASLKDRGLNLFNRIPSERTCEHASILPHWCACREQKSISTRTEIIKEVADQVLSYLNNETLPHRSVCAKLKLYSIDKAYSTVIKEASNQGKIISVVDYQITITTVPSMGRFEATIRHYESDQVFEGSGDVSRTNIYGNQSHCIDNFVLKKYCFCVEE